MYFLLCLLFLPDLRALGAADFAIRQRAEARLARHADLVWRILPVDSPDPEVRRRARRVRARAVPGDPAPIALLAGSPLAEWLEPSSLAVGVGSRPGDGWVLSYLRPDPQAPWPLRLVIRHYGERARTQLLWRDWHSDPDGREASRLLLGDLLALGVPPCLLRALASHLREREERLHGR